MSLEKSGRLELLNKLDSVKEKYPNSPIPQYLEAYLEQDADRAVLLYRSVIDNYSNSPYAVSARLKIAKYYYAKGSYISARQELDQVSKKFPNSSFIPETKFLAARCLMATGNYSIAEEEFKHIIRTYPHSPYKSDAREELKLIIEKFKQMKDDSEPARRQESRDEFPKTEIVAERYTIQIGAYSDERNANRQRDFYSHQGYDASVRSKHANNRRLYVVWIGDFASRDEAMRFGEDFKSRNGLSFQVVPK
ncbi:MAG: SPOR domain-containing protein [Candidatus Zhuqueibacterota bacterium]